MSVVVTVIHQHSDSVLALRIVFSTCLVIVFFAGLYLFRIRKRLFDRDPQVTGENYGARNLRYGRSFSSGFWPWIYSSPRSLPFKPTIPEF